MFLNWTVYLKGVKMKEKFILSALVKMINQKRLRQMLMKKIDDYIYENIVNEESEDLETVQLRRYQYLSAMLNCVFRNIDKGHVSKEITKNLVNVFVKNCLIGEDESNSTQAMEDFKARQGQ